MRVFLLIVFLSVNIAHSWGQDIGTVEIQLSEAVAAWQNAAADLDEAIVELSKIQRQYDDMVRARDWMEKNLQSRKEHKDSPKRVKKAKKAFKAGEKKVKKLLRQLNSQQREVNKLMEKVEENRQLMNRLMIQRNELEKGENEEKKGENKEKKVHSGYFPKYKSFYKATINEDVYYNPPKFNCKKDFDGTDPVLNKHRIEYAESVFFTYQPEYMPLKNDEAYMTGSSFFTLVEGGQFFLNLKIRIQTDNPRQDYGYLERHSRLFITFMNGEELVLLNNLLNLGTINKKKGTVLFRGQYALNVYAQNKIKKNPIDKIRIEWAKGYEDYQIYHIDLLQKQFKCL